jgi:Mg-chelatase subunit ChlD
MERKQQSAPIKSTNFILLKNRIGDWLKGLEGELGKSVVRQFISTVYLLIDCSSSMAESTKISQAKDGAIAFSKEAISKGHSVGVIKFDSSITHISGPVTDLVRLYQYINSIYPGGTTNMTDAIKLATQKFSSTPSRKVIVIATDGMPNNPQAALRAADEAKSKGIDIIAIGTDDADKEFLSQVASRSDLVLPVVRDKFAEGITSAAKLLPQNTR